MFYETKHPVRSDYFKIESGENLSFQPHIHRHFEFIAVTDGEMRVTVDKKEYILDKNEALFIFPNQIHSLYTVNKSRHILCVFSPELVKTFSGAVAGKIPENNQFSISEFYINRLTEGEFDSISTKGILYSLCAEFNKTARYTDCLTEQTGLLGKIFDFVERNRSGECDLSALAGELAYDYAYLSKYFKRTVGISFCKYVNAYRLGDACYMLKNSNLSVVQISYECGFASVRSFNRNFKESIGVSPLEYRLKN